MSLKSLFSQSPMTTIELCKGMTARINSATNKVTGYEIRMGETQKVFGFDTPTKATLFVGTPFGVKIIKTIEQIPNGLKKRFDACVEAAKKFGLKGASLEES